MGVSILELKLSLEMASVDQYPLFLVFRDLYRSYDTLGWGRILNTLEGYGDVPHMCGIQSEFWERQEVVTRKNRYHRPHLQANRGIIQVDNSDCRQFGAEFGFVYGEYELVSHERLVLAVGRCLGLICADEGMMVLRDPEWLQGALNMPIGLFRKYRLLVNFS